MKGLIFGIMLLAGSVSWAGCSPVAAAGPNGGDVVPINNGSAVAEVVSNANTGEVIVQTYDQELKRRQPIEPQPITVGSGQNTVELMPHPTETDPPGTCSRFYGQADWVRGGQMRIGWMQSRAFGGRQEFGWHHGWEAGRMGSRMWEDMGEHRHIGPGHAPESRGPMHR